MKLVSNADRVKAAAGRRPPARVSKPQYYDPGNLIYGDEKDEWKTRHYYRYFDLECGHETYMADQMTVAIWKPRKNTYACPRGCGWVKRKPDPPKVELPQTPLF
jgi:hypothetical protein